MAMRAYAVYTYVDERRDAWYEFHDLYADKHAAVAAAEQMAEQDDDSKPEYAWAGGAIFDAKELGSAGHMRVAVDEVKYRPATRGQSSRTAYIVYTYEDYRRDYRIELCKAFGDMQKALDCASGYGDGQESEPEYVTHKGRYFDQKEQHGMYGRVAVDKLPYHAAAV